MSADRPIEPPGLEERLRIMTRRLAIGNAVGTLGLLSLPVIYGIMALEEREWLLSLVYWGPVLVVVAIVQLHGRRRRGPGGQRWLERLRAVAATDHGWTEVDVWFIHTARETDRTMRTALVAAPGAEPTACFGLVPHDIVEPGRGRAWGVLERGEVVLLEVGGRSLWPIEPVSGRGMTRAMRAMSTATKPLQLFPTERPSEDLPPPPPSAPTRHQ